jgi:hypothetical protein
MPPDLVSVRGTIAAIEGEMKRIGFWQTEPLRPEQYEFTAAFAMDTMAFSAQAVREFDGQWEASHLVTLLGEFDALIEG